jgi:Zn-finger nucleic acid-binding protein
MNCPNCGAPMTLLEGKDYFVCDYCTSIYFPEENRDGVRDLQELSDVNCPVCHIPLTVGSIDKTSLLTCPKCAGILLKQWTFMNFVQFTRTRPGGAVSAPRPLDIGELNRKLACPYCSRPMETHPYLGPGNVIIDNCGNCKVIWLDYGEMNRIVTAGGRDRSQ